MAFPTFVNMQWLKKYLPLFLKGMGMGAADVVPGVSGGTIAFISGIYEELLNSIKSINWGAVQVLRREGLTAAWKHINGTFLVVLFLGIVCSFLTLAELIKYLLAEHTEMLWAFFFGLVLASSVFVLRQISKWGLGILLALLIGASIAFYITVATPAQTPESHWFIIITGSIAICAMILPGISGSFVLLLMGKYEYMMAAISDRDLMTIGLFGMGCIIGLLSFSHILSWTFKKFRNLTLAFLGGFLIGSLNKIYPWKQTIETFMDRHGVEKPLVQENVLPTNYLELTQQEPHIFGCLLVFVFGMLLILGLEKMSGKTV